MPQGYDFGRGGGREGDDRTALLEPHERRSISLTQENTTTNHAPQRGQSNPDSQQGYEYAPSDSDDEDIEVYPPKSNASSDSGHDNGPFELSTSGVPVAHQAHLATLAEKRALWWRNVLITTMFILSWYAFATLLSLYNKWMFSPEYYGFTYPLFVTSCHMLVQFSLASVIRYTVPQFCPVERPTRGAYVTRIFPTAASTGADIGLSNLSLKTISLSLYTMCKSSALIFVLMFAFLFKLEKFSVRLVFVIALISGGVFLMVMRTTAVSIPGIIMVFSASAIGGLRWALTELIMHKRAMGLSNPFATIFWLSPLMGIVLVIVSLATESWKEIFGARFFGNPLLAFKSVGVIALPGGLAFAMVASEYFVIQRAGVVPLSIAGIFKEVTTITVSAWVFGDILTHLNIIGVVVTMFGIALYSFHKYQKSLAEDLALDEQGNPIPLSEDDERAPLRPRGNSTSRHSRTGSHASHATTHRSRGSVASHVSHIETPVGVQMHELASSRASRISTAEDEEDRTARLRDDFEGWDRVGIDDDESEMDDDEVERYRAERKQSRWKTFWEGSM